MRRWNASSRTLRLTSCAAAALRVIGSACAMRRGWFEIYDGVDAHELIDRLVVIARVPSRHGIVIVAESDLFERLKPGELAPQYTIIVHTHRNDAAERFDYTFEAQRVR